MRARPAIRTLVLMGFLLALVAALSATSALAGQFTVASCQADQLGFTTSAFSDFATRGMDIRRACNPEGPGIRGLVTGNVRRRGALPRGSVAMVALSAPAGTSFTTFRWAGSARRTDCRYALQLYAEGPGIKAVPIRNVRANRGCPGHSGVQAAGYQSRTFNVTGTTRIIQRVICQGGDGYRSCSSDGRNYIRTYKAEVGIADNQPPTATIAPDAPLATGAWVSGTQPLNYDAEDNVGVRLAEAVFGADVGGSDSRSCSLATPQGEYATGVPCANGVGHLSVRTTQLHEGTQQLAVRVQDTAGNVATSTPVTARIDNGAPPRVSASAEGGEAWRNSNNFALAWSNPAEVDRAPVAAAEYKLCDASGGSCRTGEQAGDQLARLPMQVPAPGQWTASVWLKDAAGNADPGTASEPVTLRYDPEPPQLAFDAPSASDPTLVTVSATDKVSGVADGTIEISAAGSNTWQTLDTKLDGARLVTRIDDASLPDGSYQLRAVVHDQARNEASTMTRADGQPMVVALPLRVVSGMRAGVVGHRTVRRVVRRHGHRRTERRRVTELRPRAQIRLGGHRQVAGSLTNRDGQGIPGAEVQVLATVPGQAEQLVGVVHTDQAGDFAYTAAGSTSRTLRFAYSGSPVIRPTESQVELTVPAVSTLRVNRHRLLNGQSVTFSGQVRSMPVPATGKLVQMEVRVSGHWQTFRTMRTDSAGRWSLRYRFERTRGVQRYRFRVALPPEAGYPFGAGASKSIHVQVRGL
jgi:hypothetical protein